MPRDFMDSNYGNVQRANPRERDIVLSSNEYCYVQSQTDGLIKTYTGPCHVTISQQDSLVIFNSNTKRFEETTEVEKARKLFTSAPEGWYVVLKNPTSVHPEQGRGSLAPADMKIGTKVNLPGPVTFALFPGQMANAIQGHRLRSNQYLLARVYDADAAKKNIGEATILNAEGKEIKETTEYFVGQILVIKGTEVSFYIPPTGIEVIPVEKNVYVRDAVTLERLEYVILKDESGEKRYVPGPAVVFPKPTETFTLANNGKPIFRALELSPISGIYVKVIADYKDEDGTEHKTGEELIITGKDQMIYYPRPEHALIQYDGKYMDHAIAIPAGEGRYILDRIKGNIKTVVGPAMYLPDPRTEVVVKRKLSCKECALFYPGNDEVLAYNQGLSEKAVEKLARKGLTNSTLDTVYSTARNEDSLAIFEATSNISRGVSYTKPRTITLDTKYDGVVTIDVWTGYAVNVVSKNGNREVVVGPTTRLLDYEETLEALELSTGKPKTTDKLLRTAFLRIENNKISDVINIQTKDYVDVQVKVSYCVDFLKEYKDKWFSIENYVKFLCDRIRSLLKREAKKYTIEEFYSNSTDIVRKVALADSGNKPNKDEKQYHGRLFKENGMLIKDVEVLSVAVERNVASILEEHQEEMIKKNLELTDAEARLKVITALAENERKEAALKNQNKLYEIELEHKTEQERIAKEAEIEALESEKQRAMIQAQADMQEIRDLIANAKREQEKANNELRIDFEKKKAEIEKAKQDAYAETVSTIMASISDDLVAALSASSNEHMLAAVTKSMSPYAMANGESVSEVTNRLLRGTSLEKVLDKITDAKDNM